MNKIKTTDNSKTFFLILLVAMIIFVFFIIKPFLITIITSLILSYIFYPIFKRINKKLNRKNLSALITILLAVIIITLPLMLAMNTVAKEARINYLLVKQKITTGDIIVGECDTSSFICSVSKNIQSLASEPRTKYYLDTAAERVSIYLIDSISNFLFSIPAIIFNIFIMLFIMFYFFKDADKLFGKIEKLSPLRRFHYKKIIKRFDNVIFSVVFGYIIIALVEGTLGALILFLLGVNSPILLGFIIAIFAVIPIVGPPLVWLPIAIMMIIEGYTTKTPITLIKGIILILYGIFIIGAIDNVFKPKIIGKRANVHPILVLLGVLGGLKMFGLIGIIIGPVILAVFMTFLEIYEEQKGVLFR